MSNIHKGVGCHWGVGSTTYTLTNGKLQTRDHTRKSEMETVRDADGITVNKTYYDPNEEGTLEFVITGSAGTGNAAPVLPSIGDVVTLTDSVYTQVSGSATGLNVWLVEDCSTKSSNTSCMRATFKLQRYAGMTVA